MSSLLLLLLTCCGCCLRIMPPEIRMERQISLYSLDICEKLENPDQYLEFPTQFSLNMDKNFVVYQWASSLLLLHQIHEKHAPKSHQECQSATLLLNSIFYSLSWVTWMKYEHTYKQQTYGAKQPALFKVGRNLRIRGQL